MSKLTTTQTPAEELPDLCYVLEFSEWALLHGLTTLQGLVRYQQELRARQPVWLTRAQRTPKPRSIDELNAELAEGDWLDVALTWLERGDYEVLAQRLLQEDGPHGALLLAREIQRRRTPRHIEALMDALEELDQQKRAGF